MHFIFLRFVKEILLPELIKIGFFQYCHYTLQLRHYYFFFNISLSCFYHETSRCLCTITPVFLSFLLIVSFVFVQLLPFFLIFFLIHSFVVKKLSNYLEFQNGKQESKIYTWICTCSNIEVMSTKK